MKWIGILYVLFLGIILAITTGFGVAGFYPQPAAPAYPLSVFSNTIPDSCYSTPDSQSSLDCQRLIQKQQAEREQEIIKRDQYEKDVQIYKDKDAGYTRTAIFFGISIGALYAITGLVLIKKSKKVAIGLLLAGILTAILTRILIMLASLGSSVTGTSGADSIAYIEFGILLVLSLAVIAVGLYSLKDHEEITTPSTPKPTSLPINQA